MSRLSLFAAALLLCSCTRLPLKIESDFVSRQNLASFHVGTPDPLLNCPPVGQRLMLTWALPGSLVRKNRLQIFMTIVYGDYTKEVKLIEPRCPWGIHVTSLLNEEYFEKCGIITYKAELFCGERLLYQWRHLLWTEIITFPEEPEEKDPLLPCTPSE